MAQNQSGSLAAKINWGGKNKSQEALDKAKQLYGQRQGK